MDNNLEFLKEVGNEELSVFVDIIIDKGKLTEKLTKSEEYKKFGNDYKCYAERISNEYLDFGTNTIKNFISGRKQYKEILCDVAKDMDVKFDKTSDVSLIEDLLLEKLLWNSWNKLSDNEKKELVAELAPNKTILTSQDLKESNWLLENNDLVTYKTILFIQDQISISTLGRNIKTALKFAFTRVLFGPLSWIYAVHSIAGPAYRVIAPCTILIATMRKKLLLKNKLGIKG